MKLFDAFERMKICKEGEIKHDKVVFRHKNNNSNKKCTLRFAKQELLVPI
uniref:Uncharacterized protein n=1 Tax=Arundo donax TaxID=35708 RepID=A0A0A9EKW3_ARUDO